MTDKKTRKKLMGMDSLQTGFWQLAGALSERRGVILAAIMPVILIVLGLWVWSAYQSSQNDALRDELGKIDKRVESYEQKSANLKAQLRTQIDTLKKSITTSKGDVETVANQAELIKLEAKMKSLESPPEDIMSQYEAFFAKHIEHAVGWRAGFTLARIHLNKDEFSAAEELLRKVLAHALGVDFYQIQVRSMYVAVLQELGEYAKALEEVATLSELAGEDFKPHALFTKALILQKLGKETEAQSALTQLIKDFSSSQEARQARALQHL